jgi:hypothetical protein
LFHLVEAMLGRIGYRLVAHMPFALGICSPN